MIALEAQLKALMLAALAGDAASYRVLLDILSRQLRSYFSRRLAQGADAEDLVQETLIAIHSKRDTYDATQPLTAWVYAIARYKLIDHLRRHKRRRAAPIADAEALPAADDLEPVLASRDVEQLLAQLPEKSRALIRQMKIEGLSASETAVATGMSESAVKVGVHRGLRALAQRIRKL